MNCYKLLAASIMALWLSSNAAATTVSYDATDISGNEWQLSYDVTNNSLNTPISELTIYFDPTLFSNLAVGPAQPSAWNSPIAVQADPALLPDLSGYAFFDTVASDSGIPVGGSLGGFSALVDYSGSGTPADQVFQVVDPNTFNTLDQGATVLGPSGPPVAAPEIDSRSAFASGTLLMGCLMILRGRRRRRRETEGATAAA